MTPTLTDEQRAYLTDHMWAVLATGRNDGSPQVSMIGYQLDEEDRLVISIKSYTAKWKNALRQPHVAVMVPDRRANATIYGTAECIDTDPVRAELTADVFERLSGEDGRTRRRSCRGSTSNSAQSYASPPTRSCSTLETGGTPDDDPNRGTDDDRSHR